MSRPVMDIYRDAVGQWRYRMLDDGSVNVADGPTAYNTKYEAMEGYQHMLEIAAWLDQDPQVRVIDNKEPPHADPRR